MKMQITFTDLSPEEVVAIVTNVMDGVEFGAAPAIKRKRRTKAEIAVAKADADLTKLEEEQEKEIAAGAKVMAEKTPVRRRKQRGAKAAPAEQPTRRKGRDRKKDEDSEITDTDLTKAASDAAQELTPKIVREIIDQFGVGNVAELDQGQRREFIDLLKAKLDEDKISF